MKKTKILVTIGPASVNKIPRLIEAGMDACRINASHNSPEEFEDKIKKIRIVKNIPIVLDTQGPEIRLVIKLDILLRKNQVISNISFKPKLKLKKNQLVLVNDGRIKLKVSKVNPLEFIPLTEGTLTNNAGVNLPNVKLNLDSVTKTDKKLIRLAIKNKIDYVAVSYSRTAQDIKKVKTLLGKSNIDVIAKIENYEGVKNFNSILREADGVMVARGDLGVELESQKIPLIQKDIIRKCNQEGKLVITATQMLQSMIEHSTPTRAETSDVANAILDGSDVIMLSAETAIGKYPVLSVKEICKIAKEVEDKVQSNVNIETCTSVSEALSKSIYEMTRLLPITKIITLTRSGYTARMISRFKLNIPIIAITINNQIKKKLELYYGISSEIFPEMTTRQRIEKVTKYLYKKEYINSNDLILFTAGVLATEPGQTNLLEIHKAKDLLKG